MENKCAHWGVPSEFTDSGLGWCNKPATHVTVPVAIAGRDRYTILDIAHTYCAEHATLPHVGMIAEKIEKYAD